MVYFKNNMEKCGKSRVIDNNFIFALRANMKLLSILEFYNCNKSKMPAKALRQPRRLAGSFWEA